MLTLKTFSPRHLKNRFLINYSFLKKEPVSRGLPAELTIELSNKCNLHCIMCPHDKMKRKQGFMSFALFRKIIDEVKNHAELVDLDLFGESLMNPDVFKMISYCKSKGIKTLLNSNMSYIDEEKSKKLIESGLDMLTISFDGATKETYEKIRKGASYEKTIKNIQAFLKLKGNKKPYTRIQMIYMTHTKKEAENFLSLWKSTNADFIRLKPFINLDRQKNFNALQQFEKNRYEKPCIMLWRNLSIYWNGDVVPCCDDYDSMYVIGNARRATISSLWNSAPLVGLRKKHLQGKQKSVRLCSQCRYFEPSNLFVIGSIFIDAFTARKILPFFEKMIILKNKDFMKY